MSESLHWQSATIRAVRDLSPTVREFEIRPEGGVRRWTVGSHLCVEVEIDGRAEMRHYSLVGVPHAPGAERAYRIAVKRAEPGRGGSRWMWALPAGAELRIAGPENRFELSFNAPQHLLVAGGIGITPLLGMAQMLAERGADLRMCYAARSDDELVYADALRSSLGPRLRKFVGARGERIDLDAEVATLAPGAMLWVCGPLPLLDAAREAWARAGRDAAGLRFETFGNTGRIDAQPFWVELPRHQLRIEVPAHRTLLDVLEEAGVETLSECRRGECGLCALDILDVQGEVDHRDVFFSAAEKRANRRICACVSRVSGGVVIDSAWRPDT